TCCRNPLPTAPCADSDGSRGQAPGRQRNLGRNDGREGERGREPGGRLRYIGGMSDLFAAQRPDAGPAGAYPYLSALNEGQRAAVEALDGAVLVLAGAGTGKTRVLTTRLAHLLITGKARSPGEILAVTFTNKAAREMKDRVAALLNRPSVEGWWLGTFHAVAVRILRRHAEAVGLKSNFTILDPDDQVRLVKQLLQAENVDEKKWPARAMLAIIERWKDRGLTPERVSAGEAGDFA